MADRDDDLSWWDELRSPPGGDEDSSRLSPFSWTDESISALDHVRSLFRQSLPVESAPPPTLRGAATDLFRAAGLFGETPAADDASIAATGAPADAMGPPSWKQPSRGTPPTILGDDTAAGPLRGAGPNIGSAPSMNDLPGVTASSVARREPAAPGAPTPLDHPDARAGLALTAADTLLTKGIDLAVNLAGGNPALARKLVELAANGLAGVLPQEFRASARTSAAAAAAEAERRIGDNDRATRTRAALGTLANRRNEAEQEHSAAVIAGDRSKIEEARRDAIDAWRAERRARGDGDAEINAAARALERDYRKTALRHRLAQMDEAGITRALGDDEDAKADPGMARELADDIRSLRRNDPARVAEASIEREIAARKRDGRIDTPEEEAAARYKLRLDAQARRGIPENERRLLTNDERRAFELEYRRIEAAQSKDAADKWLHEQAMQAGPHGKRVKAEVSEATAPVEAATTRTDPPPIGQQRKYAQSQGAATEDDSSLSQQRPDGGTRTEQVRPEDRRQPEPPISSYSVGAELGVPHPTSPLRELRKLIGGIRSVAAFKGDGTPVMSNQDVTAYLDEARKYIRPEYQDIFEITVLAVRAGMIPWWRAHERLREYFAPESTGEALLDGILDFVPIVGQVKGAIEAGEALDGLRIALDEGDQDGAAKFAADAALLIAGLVPILKVGKFAKRVPGLEKLKDVLGEFAGGRLPFHEFLEKWNRNWKLHGHHSFPIFLGGAKDNGIASLRAGVHQDLHRELSAFLRGITNAEGKHMRPQRGNSGEVVRENFPTKERVQAMADYYSGPGNRLKYRNARREFFRLFPELAQ